MLSDLQLDAHHLNPFAARLGINGINKNCLNGDVVGNGNNGMAVVCNGFNQLPVTRKTILPLMQTGEMGPPVVNGCNGTRNPRLFHEAMFVVRPKFVPERRNGYHNGYANGNGHSSSSSTATPDSLRGSLRKEGSLDRDGQPTAKKHVQFHLPNGYAAVNGNSVHCDNEPLSESDQEDSSLCEQEEEPDLITDIERSLMHGYSEYDLNGLAEDCTDPLVMRLHAQPGSGRKKPHFRLDLRSTFSCRGDAINTDIPLDEQPWYFGTVSRQDAENILRKCTNGCYIVRSCEVNGSKDYSLAIKSSLGFMHLRIHRQQDDMYRLADFNRVFLTVPDLIEYYSMERLPIKGTDYMILLHPVHQQLL